MSQEEARAAFRPLMSCRHCGKLVKQEFESVISAKTADELHREFHDGRAFAVITDALTIDGTQVRHSIEGCGYHQIVIGEQKSMWVPWNEPARIGDIAVRVD
jgi:hypothetical protein